MCGLFCLAFGIGEILCFEALCIRAELIEEIGLTVMWEPYEVKVLLSLVFCVDFFENGEVVRGVVENLEKLVVAVFLFPQAEFEERNVVVFPWLVVSFGCLFVRDVDRHDVFYSGLWSIVMLHDEGGFIGMNMQFLVFDMVNELSDVSVEVEGVVRVVHCWLGLKVSVVASFQPLG